MPAGRIPETGEHRGQMVAKVFADGLLFLANGAELKTDIKR